MDPSPQSLPDKTADETPAAKPAKGLPAEPTPSPEPPRIAPDSHPKKPDLASAENQEVDVWWGAYAGRTMAPSFVVCVLVTGLITWAVWYFWPASEERPYLKRYTIYILIGAVWLFQLVRWSYRILGINYRLTSKRLFCQRGFHTSGSHVIDLTHIATVRVERLPLVNFLKVGQLRVVPIDDSKPPVILESVVNPDRVAAMITRQVKSAREQKKSGTMAAPRDS